MPGRPRNAALISTSEGGRIVKFNSLDELLVDQLQDLYDAENQLVKALPNMAKAASNSALRQGFEEHLQQTKGHVDRLEKVFKDLGKSAKRKTCEAMKGLIREGKETIHAYAPS